MGLGHPQVDCGTHGLKSKHVTNTNQRHIQLDLVDEMVCVCVCQLCINHSRSHCNTIMLKRNAGWNRFLENDKEPCGMCV